MRKREEAVQRLISDNIRLVHYVVNNLCNIPNHLREDAISEGYLALCRAARNYKKKLGVNFSTYACVVISRQIFCFVRRQVLYDERKKEYSEYQRDKHLQNMQTKSSLHDDLLDLMLAKERGGLMASIIKEKECGSTVKEMAEKLGVEQDKIIRMIAKWRMSHARENTKSDLL